jgi:hypothetical protein
MAGLVLSIALSALFFVGIPIILILAWRNGDIWPNRPLLLIAGFWAFGVGWHVILSLAIYYDHYMAPLIPFMIIGGLVAGRSFSSRHYKLRLAEPRPD